MKNKLEEIGFSLKRWILFDFKGTLKEGKGQRIDPLMLADPSKKRSARDTIQRTATAPSFANIQPTEILDVPWVKSRSPAGLYCQFRHRPKWYCNADVGVGHEIYAIAVKPVI